MDLFESYFQQERHYLRQLEQLTAEEKPHLADSLSGHDPDIERLNEGFAALMGRQRQKIDDAFPEITLPLLQRLQAQTVKGIPATSVVQFDGGTDVDFSCTLPRGTTVTTSSGVPFITSRTCAIEPLALVARHLTHQLDTTRLTLTFQYIGKEDHWPIKPLSLFLSPDEAVADTLMLALCHHFRNAELHHNGQVWPAEPLGFSPLSGTDRLVLSPPIAVASNWAPQMLMESLYLPHVHHFLTLALPTVMSSRLSMTESQQFSITLIFDDMLPLSESQLAEAFRLHCVPVVNLERKAQVTFPFAPETARYPLPLPNGQALLHVTRLELKDEPEEARGQRCTFAPISQLSHFVRDTGEEQWFYALDITRDALGRLEYALVFYDSHARLMAQPPEREFTCHFVAFDSRLPELVAGDICHADENIPDGLQVKNLTPCSLSYPPVTDSHRHWALLSHYSASLFWLHSVDALR
ncbi:type VI secretion system baseplate subunit TssF [Xenorhabdus japonica]|uniref:Type VI secretion system protein ImpG n=1 Tax=Xenorhabdus japonica TaxID=53341 RepID=A0A1I4ZA98_9GAMM|nr:type VI secretion system baseplate subunit TssF [Xenorhabdus japonica]SFN47214.1 type VI secretion system protein ImpG [Xenorhabdus japonica]